MERKSIRTLGLSALLVAASFAVASAQPATPATPATVTPAKSAAPAKPAGHAKAAATAKAPVLDLNSASKEELEKLPGIGDALAEKIIAARPFKARSELRTKGVLTRAEYAKVRLHVTAKQG